jgi:SAM-dependent methyltransferase
MLNLGKVGAADILYDLGSGDGRIVIAAARRGARSVGIEIDAGLIERARANASEAGVGQRASFRRQDLFKADFREATVVTLYLWPHVNLMLRPQLLRDLKPGVRIVSHSHDMGDWAPQETVELPDATGRIHRLYLWTVPPRKDQPPLAASDARPGAE